MPTKLTFEQWMSKVNDIVSDSMMGLDTNDLGDRNYRDMYDAGQTPNDAARDVIAEEGFGDFDD